MNSLHSLCTFLKSWLRTISQPIMLVCLLWIGTVSLAHAQTAVSWTMLQACELPNGRIDYTSEVELLDQQEITIQGFMIPLDATGTEYALSAYPMNQCFFCGEAGPASIMELEMQKPKRYKLDAYRTFTGRLVLSLAPQGMVFKLEEAEEK